MGEKASMESNIGEGGFRSISELDIEIDVFTNLDSEI
jgi:hypothetical protein